MKRIYLLLPLIFILVFTSCNKDDSNKLPAPPPVIPKDTLATGWKKITISDSADLGDIFFIGNTCFTGGIGPNIFTSKDGGESWEAISKPPQAGANTDMVNIGMGDENNAVLTFPHSNLLVTHDGGSSVAFHQLSDYFVADVFFVNPSTVYGSGGSIWKSTDAGEHWTKLYTFTNFSSYHTICFVNEQKGWTYRAEDGLYKTVNGGVDWQLVPTPFDTQTGGAVFFQNADTGFVSNAHDVERTTNGGSTWTKVFSGTGAYHDIAFVSPNTGYITDSTSIYKTIDGGNTWSREVFLASNPVFGLHFSDPHHGLASGSKGTILKFNQ